MRTAFQEAVLEAIRLSFRGYHMGTMSTIEVIFGGTTGTYMIHIETFQLPSGRHFYG